MAEYGTADYNKIRDLESKVTEQTHVIRSLYGVIVRTLVTLKQTFRIGAVGGVWFFYDKQTAYGLALFIILSGLIQLTIDKTRRVVHPDLKLSEWDIT